jgi:subtilisin
MNARSNDVRGGERRSLGDDREGIGTRSSQYMVAPARPGLGEKVVLDRLQDIGGVEIVRSLAAHAAVGPPVVVARMTPAKASALRRSAGGALLVELDEPLRCACPAVDGSYAPAVACALGAGFATTVQVLSDSDAPLERAEVQLVGQYWRTQGVTGSDGKVALTLYGELPDTVMELIVKPRVGHWGLRRSRPKLQADAVNVVALRPLAEVRQSGWVGRAMGLDRLPPEYRGGGVKIALIDSGVATSHKQLHGIELGFPPASAGERESWSQDPIGHGTACAGIISAAWDTPKVEVVAGLRGYASEAELRVCKLPLHAHTSDLVAALDYCMASGVDLACIGFGSQHGSTIVEQRIVAAKQRGIGIIAAAGSSGGPVQYPACSPHVLAVGAIGQAGTFPDDSVHALHCASAAAVGGGFFVPAFSSTGPEIDLCAPGVAVISCQSPEGYAAGDGTSLAAPHVAALAALVLAHHVDFRRDFANRDARRVERLFQILKETAQPLGNPVLTGAGLPRAPVALGLQAHAWTPHVSLGPGMEEMRDALRRAGLAGFDYAESPGPLPQRGPAFVAPLPLTPLWPQGIGVMSPDAWLSDLKAAMRLAGLSTGP